MVLESHSPCFPIDIRCWSIIIQSIRYLMNGYTSKTYFPENKVCNNTYIVHKMGKTTLNIVCSVFSVWMFCLRKIGLILNVSIELLFILWNKGQFDDMKHLRYYRLIALLLFYFNLDMKSDVIWRKWWPSQISFQFNVSLIAFSPFHD